jgi:hypothetical protein
MTGSRWDKKWDQRIERARELAAAHPFAAEGLRFYERIAASRNRFTAASSPGGAGSG